MKNTAQGAATTVYAVLSKDWEGKGGKYLEDCDIAEPVKPGAQYKGYKEYIYDMDKEDRTWALTLETLGLEEN